ncbi:MAG: phospholipase D-like domain-containing protein, partial [Planctomycetota bacterium]
MSKTQTVSEALEATLSDQRLSRGERKTLRAVLAELDLSSADHAALRKKAFTLAAAAVEDGQGGAAAVIDWLEDVVKVLVGDLTGTATGATPSAVPGNEAHFSPGDTCRDRIIGLFRTARTSADVCVFTITDNTSARAIVDAHRRGVKVRIISDNDKAFDRGSDVMDLDDAG